MLKFVFIVSAWALLAMPVQAEGELGSKLTAADKTRLAGYAATRAAAIAEARAGGDAADLAILTNVLADGNLPFNGGFDPTGKWRCRTIKLGGNLPLTVYGWFNCKISDDGSGWYLVKTSGSQRTSGRFYDDDEKRLVYLGALHYDREHPIDYAKDAERDQVAYVFRPAENRLRMEFPSPQFESKLDIIELTR